MPRENWEEDKAKLSENRKIRFFRTLRPHLKPNFVKQLSKFQLEIFVNFLNLFLKLHFWKTLRGGGSTSPHLLLRQTCPLVDI